MTNEPVPSGAMPFRVRRMTIDDLARVHEIDKLSFTLSWSERSFRFELIENQNASVWVAEMLPPDAPPVVAGAIVVWTILDEAHVATIAVHPDFRRMGLGRALLAQGLLDSHARGGRMGFLEVRRSNFSAQAMYLDFGFYIAGERKRYYQDNHEDALLMTLAVMDPQKLQDAVPHDCSQDGRE